jgi:hypothetical protein
MYNIIIEGESVALAIDGTRMTNRGLLLKLIMRCWKCLLLFLMCMHKSLMNLFIANCKLI